MISKFQPKNIMISEFWAKKLLNSGRHVLSISEFNGKTLFHLVYAPRWVLIFTDY